VEARSRQPYSEASAFAKSCKRLVGSHDEASAFAEASADESAGCAASELEAEIILVALERTQLRQAQEVLESLVQADELKFAMVFLGIHP
jgi:hypothetical protein